MLAVIVFFQWCSICCQSFVYSVVCKVWGLSQTAVLCFYGSVKCRSLSRRHAYYERDSKIVRRVLSVFYLAVIQPCIVTVLYCTTVYCHFFFCVLQYIKVIIESFISTFLDTALRLKWLNTIMVFSSKLHHLFKAFCSSELVFKAFSALWAVASFTSTRLHTTWAFPLEMESFPCSFRSVCNCLFSFFFWVISFE